VSLIVLPSLIQGSDIARFWKFVHKSVPSQCWEWQSTRNRSGYGKFWLNGRTDIAHRVSYRIHHGPIPAGIQVRHTCDNPPCVNPSHLLLGTGKENARDALERDRYRRGSRNGRAKLTESQVAEIRRCWASGETQVSMAQRFGVSKSAIQWVLNGRNWAGIGDAS
jgi:hypothetical protein